MEVITSSEMIYVAEEEDAKKQMLYWQVLLQHLESWSDISEQVDIQFSDGNAEKMSWIVLAALSSTIREYLDYVDKSTILDPIVIVPDLDHEDFKVFKRYLYSLNVSGQYKVSDMTSLKNVFDLLGINPEFLRDDEGQDEDFEAYDHDDETMNETDQSESQAPERVIRREKTEKKLPAIISHSRYGRPRRPPQASTKRSPFIDEDDLDDTSSISLEESSLNCHYCPKSYAHAKARNKHMLAEHLAQCKADGNIFPCSVCPAIFVSKLGREKHVKRIHPLKVLPNGDDDNGFRCPFPHENDEVVRLSKLKDLHSHAKTCHPDKDKSCLGCGEDFASKSGLDSHIQTHRLGTANSKPFFFCEHCGKVFTRQYTLVMHKRNEHSTMKETLECQHCGKDFKSAKFLKHHEDKHLQGLEEEGQHICQDCGKTFPSRLNLERHLKSTHQKIKDHQCSDCGKKFVDSTRLKEHKWIHMDYRPFKCRFCELTFRHRNHVKHHEAKAHEVAKDFKCDICLKTFCYAYELSSHAKTHDKDSSKATNTVHSSSSVDGSHQDLWVFQCPFCIQVCPSIVVLNDHIAQKHTDDAPKQGETITILPDNTGDQVKTSEILLEVEEMDHDEEPSYIVQYVYDDQK